MVRAGSRKRRAAALHPAAARSGLQLKPVSLAMHLGHAAGLPGLQPWVRELQGGTCRMHAM